jgi:hypothetical protein
LSLTGVQAFLREDLTRFCREAPPEFTHPQRDVFCVFSGDGVSRLREYLKRLAEDQEREGRISREESAVYSEAEADSSRETISDDETIDAPENMQERRPMLLPRPAGYRSYADVVSGSGSDSPERGDIGDGNEEDLPLSQNRSGRIGTRLRRRSSRPGSFTENDVNPLLRGHIDGHTQREASRSISEGQVSSSRPRFSHSDVPTFDDYFPAMAETQPRRPLPPRPHWPPQAHTAQFYDGEQQIPASAWGDFPTASSSRDPTRSTESGQDPRRNGVHGREDSAASAVYDTDGDEEMTMQQSPRRHRDMDGEMES